MARALKLPIAVTAVVVILASLGIPPRHIRYAERKASAATLPRLLELRGQIQETRDALERTRIGAVVGQAPWDDGVRVSSQTAAWPAEAHEEIEVQARSAIDGATEHYGIEEPVGRMTLVFTAPTLPGTEGNDARRGPVPPAGSSKPWLTEHEDGTTECTALVAGRDLEGIQTRLDRWGDWVVLSRATPCLLPFWFGAPGPRIAEWYASWGRRFARHTHDTGPLGLRRVDVADQVRRGAFGRRSAWWAYGSLEGDACRAGRFEQCRRVVIGPENTPTRARAGNPRTTPIGSYSDSPNERAFGGYASTLLLDMLVEFGPERFANFWTDPRDVEQAFESHFGSSIEQWTHDWAVDLMGPDTSGPSVPLTAAAGGFLLLGLCMGYGAWRAERRRA